MLQYEGIKLNSSNLIGKGSFTKAYRNKNTVYVVSHCPAKEAIALFCTSSKHLPAIERLEYSIDDKGNSVYKMPYYAKINKALHPKAWKHYQAIKRVVHAKWNNSKMDVCLWIEVFEEDKTIPKKLRNDIIAVLDAMTNYTLNVGVEISPRNIGVDRRGNLVLLDIVFSRDVLRKTY